MANRSITAEIYDGTASFGLFMSKIYLFFSFVISGIIVYFSTRYYINNKDKTYIPTNGIISKPTCNFITNYNHSTKVSTSGYICSLPIKYTFNNVSYDITLTTNSLSQYLDGQQIQIFVNSNNPQEAILTNTMSVTTLYAIFLAIAFFILFIAWFNYYLSSNYKPYASLEAIDTVF